MGAAALICLIWLLLLCDLAAPVRWESSQSLSGPHSSLVLPPPSPPHASSGGRLGGMPTTFPGTGAFVAPADGRVPTNSIVMVVTTLHWFSHHAPTIGEGSCGMQSPWSLLSPRMPPAGAALASSRPNEVTRLIWSPPSPSELAAGTVRAG